MSLLFRPRPSRPAPTTTAALRSQIRPPETWGQAAPVWQRLRCWLTGAAPTAPDALSPARADFLAALAGLEGHGAHDLGLRAQAARSLRELWHLRAELYNLIARQHSQGEAERRLAPVNHHFAAPAARSPRPRAATPSRHPSETVF